MEEKVCSFTVLNISLQHQVFLVLQMTRYCPDLELAICVFICGILEFPHPHPADRGEKHVNLN